MEWQGERWVGAVALVGGAAVVLLALGATTSDVDAKPFTIAKVGAIGGVIALVGVGWLRQARRASVTQRCSFCTNMLKEPRSEHCAICSENLHEGCVRGHEDTYHPAPSAMSPKAEGIYR